MEEEASNLDEGFSDSEVIYEDDLVEVVDLGEDRPQEEELMDELEDMGLAEEEEEEENGEQKGAVNVKSDAMTVFKKHKGSVFSVSLHPSNALVCSGGEDDRAFLWRPTTASILLECIGHKDSVACTEFSSDGKYLATGDLSGGIKVWEMDERQLVCSFEASDLEWMHWHPQAHVLLAGTGDGGGWMWRVPSGECKMFQGQNCRNICSAILPNGKHIVCGYEDGGVRVWNMKECSTVTSISPSHTAPLTSVAAHSDGALLMTGSEDSTARLVNSTSGKVVATFAAGMPVEGAEDAAPSVEDVAFCPSLPLVLTASLSGAVGVWDITTQKLRHRLQHQAGVTQLYSSAVSSLVFTSCLDGGVRVWDVRGGECVKEWKGHFRDILCLAVARDDSIVVSGSDDTTAQVFSNS